MHFFYGVKSNLFKSELQIPTFKNRYFSTKNEYILCKCFIKDNKWQFEKLLNKKINDKFFLVKYEYISNDEFFFLISEEGFSELIESELREIDKFAVRANLKVYFDNGGFSSYQSDYPFGMIEKKGNITSCIGTLANVNAENNYILFTNIMQKPIKNKFNAYLVNIKSKSKVHKYELYTNTTNILEIEKSFIKPEIYFVSDNYLGIPSFISVKNKHISFEHTHPPHAYILNSKKFDLVKKLKDKFNEIIN